ncbi:hypothetical protein FISHEDRAFT_26895, partial [Fistulina hepatica ATCC 64428]
LTWLNVVEMVQLGEFELLRESRTNVQSADWSKPAYREATSLYFSVKRAREEVVRCNVEITRQLTFMIDGFNDMRRAIEELKCAEKMDLASELQ